MHSFATFQLSGSVSTDALKIPLRIAIGQVEPAYCGMEDLEMENTICVLNIRKQTTWDDFSKTVSQAATVYFQAVASDGWRNLEDPLLNNTVESNIGLTASSIASIKLGISTVALYKKLFSLVFLGGGGGCYVAYDRLLC